MKCVKPFLSGSALYGCGQCQPCRAKRRRTWAHRLMLEALCHERNSFATLTYAPENYSGVSLRPKDMQDWLKRFRKRIAPKTVRYFGVGEYGDLTGRPHYHLALFGVGCEGPLAYGGCGCPTCCVVRETWGFGHVLLGQLTEKSARYIAGYVTKRLTSPTDPLLNGRHPEFARMSLWPGIGAAAMERVAALWKTYPLAQRIVDVPPVLRHNRNLLPLGRYLRRRLRKELGRDAQAPSVVSENAEAVRLLRAFAWNSGRSVSSVFEELTPVRPYQDRGTL